MDKISRQEINERLEILRQSRLDDESYIETKRNLMACCYRIRFPEPVKKVEKRVCNHCGKTFEILGTEETDVEKIYDLIVTDQQQDKWGHDRTGLRDLYEKLEEYERLIEMYRKAGMNAEMAFYCKDCITKNGYNPYEIRIKANDEDQWHISLPDGLGKMDRKKSYTARYEYNLVLDFLETSKEEIIAESESKYYDFKNYRWVKKEKQSKRMLSYQRLIKQNEYRDKYVNKIRIDRALGKVLGITITYDIEEIKKGIRVIWSSKGNYYLNYKEEEFFTKANEIINKSKKNTFTINEYESIINKLEKIFFPNKEE